MLSHIRCRTGTIQYPRPRRTGPSSHAAPCGSRPIQQSRRTPRKLWMILPVDAMMARCRSRGQAVRENLPVFRLRTARTRALIATAGRASYAASPTERSVGPELTVHVFDGLSSVCARCSE